VFEWFAVLMNVFRIAALGNQLVDIHLQLREQLARLRSGESAAPGDLRTHCVAFCSALTRHHSGEDAGAFPALAAQFPELAAVIAELERDHVIVADIIRAIEALPAGEPDRLHRELDGLAALLESHFVYEEKKLVAALNALVSEHPAAELLGR
jgi:hemerythrin-like domain-containing protein